MGVTDIPFETRRYETINIWGNIVLCAWQIELLLARRAVEHQTEVKEPCAANKGGS